MNHPDGGSTGAASLSAEEEQALRLSDAIISISADAIITINEAQRILRYNQGAANIFGWTPEEIIGQPIEVLIPARYRHNHRDQVMMFAGSATVARQMGERRQISGVRKNGVEFPAEASISKTRLGDAWLFTVALRDVTERLRAAQSQQFLSQATATLARSLDAEQTLQSIAPLGVPVLGDWCVVFQTLSDRPARRAAAAHAADDRAALMERIREIPFAARPDHPVIVCLTRGESVLLSSLDETLLHAMSDSADHLELLRQLAPVSALAVPLINRDRILGAICFFIDARTNRRHDTDDLELAQEFARRAALALDNAALYAAAQAAVNARDDVLAVVSHDLGNPLAAIRVSATILRRKLERLEPEATALAHHVDGIRTSVAQMERLIRDLLDIKSIEAGYLSLESERVAVGSLLDEVAETFAPLAESRGVRFARTSSPPQAYISADRERILQVFSNLLGNATKFTPPGGVIEVSFAEAPEGVEFRIRDTGPGIPAEHIPYIFDRFWQARRTGRHSIGLGLAIVKGIVDAHGGSIRVESELGAGTSFTFTIPRD